MDWFCGLLGMFFFLCFFVEGRLGGVVLCRRLCCCITKMIHVVSIGSHQGNGLASLFIKRYSKHVIQKINREALCEANV